MTLSLTAALMLASCTTTGQPVSAAARGYLSIAGPANRTLEYTFDALEGPDAGDLSASKADLLTAVRVERAFDSRLLTLRLPRSAASAAGALVAANSARVTVTIRAAAARSLEELASSEQAVSAANDPVEAQVRRLRHKLGLPPPDTA